MVMDMPADVAIIQEAKVDKKSQIIKFEIPFSEAGFFLAGIVRVKPPVEQNLSYAELRCTDEDRSKITEIITTMGTHGKVDLLLHYKKHLEKIGDDVRSVHPFKFLGVVFSNPQTKLYMKEVRDDYFKWKNFVDGISPVLANENIKGKIDVYMSDFAQEVHVSVEDIKPYIEKAKKSKDWGDMINFLIFN